MTRILLLPGDGIGPEVIAEAKACLELLSERLSLGLVFDEQPMGGAAIDLAGDPLPSSTLDACRKANAILLGAVGGPKWDGCAKRPESALLELRSQLDLFANLRPARSIRGLEHLSPLRRHITSGADILVVRELIGGFYFGEKMRGDDRASDLCVYNSSEIERVARIAFEAARGRRGLVTSIDKANVLATSELWRRVVEKVASDYPDVVLQHLYVDAAAMALITNPRRFDIVLTENLFGDILSDELAILSGSIGVLPSASLGSSGPGLFEPIHGSAPDLAGKGIANPAGAIASAAMLLGTGLGLAYPARLLNDALESVLRSGPLTADLGGSATASEFGSAVLAALEARLQAIDAHVELITMNRGCCA